MSCKTSVISAPSLPLLDPASWQLLVSEPGCGGLCICCWCLYVMHGIIHFRLKKCRFLWLWKLWGDLNAGDIKEMVFQTHLKLQEGCPKCLVIIRWIFCVFEMNRTMFQSYRCAIHHEIHSARISLFFSQEALGLCPLLPNLRSNTASLLVQVVMESGSICGHPWFFQAFIENTSPSNPVCYY